MIGLWTKRLLALLLALVSVGTGLMALISLYGAISGRIIHARVDRELRAAGEPMTWAEVVKQPTGFETEEFKQLDEVTRGLVEAYKKLPQHARSNRTDLRWNNPASLKPFPAQPLDQPKEPVPPETWRDRTRLASPLMAKIKRLQALNLPNRRLAQVDLTQGFDVNSDRLNRRLELYKALSSVAEIHMGSGRWNEAAQTVCLGYQLLEPTQSNDTMIDQLVRATIEGVIQGRCFEMLPQVDDSRLLWELLKIFGELPDYLVLADQSLTYERLMFLDVTGEQRRQVALSMCSYVAWSEQRKQTQGIAEWLAVRYLDWCWMDQLFGQTKNRHWQYQKAWRDAAGKRNVEACRLLEHRLREEDTDSPTDLSKLIGGPLVGYQKKMVCTQISRALTRTALALRVFELEQSRLPQTLEELVPAYLPEMPRDWGDGRNLRYRLESPRVYRLYSVGWDGEDQGGDPSFSEKTQGTPGFRTERMKDIVLPQIESAPR